MTVLRMRVDAHDLSLLSRALTDFASRQSTTPADKIDALHLMDRIALESTLAAKLEQQDEQHERDVQQMEQELREQGLSA